VTLILTKTSVVTSPPSVPHGANFYYYYLYYFLLLLSSPSLS